MTNEPRIEYIPVITAREARLLAEMRQHGLSPWRTEVVTLEEMRKRFPTEAKHNEDEGEA